ncbi:DUF7619 domain-containing protein [Winogradskyella helgolandensis]|uniref:DUF7619 domain-containing protein n=1 Tax=Winogradskyella helgolandensis TaxID=2697010 RepID=UPI0015BB37DA|nr:T9SS type A sorting domain-containing protein [Winogradskyella helgolandensis]
MKKSLLFILITFSFMTLGHSQWIQTGLDIDGEEADEASGYSVSLNADASLVAIGSPYGERNGLVRVYEDIGGTWTQKGTDIVGEGLNDNFGISVSFNGAGNKLAIAAMNGNAPNYTRLYEFSGGDWTQIGSDILGDDVIDNYPSTIPNVSLNDAGNIVAIQSTQMLISPVIPFILTRVYQQVGNTWEQIGADIVGADYYVGQDVSLSADGNTVAFGSPFNNSDGDDPGHVSIYENVDGVWTQIGTNINGEGVASVFGYSISLSADGSIIAIGAFRQNDLAGQVQVYQNVGGVWTQMGSGIAGEAQGDYSGFSVSLSSNGSIVAIGATRNDGNGSNSGQVRVYKYSGDTWLQVAEDMDGEAPLDGSGWSVSLSADGSKVAIGARENATNGVGSGHVRIFENVVDLSNEISGTILLDVDANGCDAMDVPVQYYRVETTNGPNRYETFTQSDGSYQLFTNAGDFTTTVPNTLPSYFTMTPEEHNSTFVGSNNMDTANFCIEPVGSYNDLSITVLPISGNPRPGYNTNYQIVYRNYGNTQVSGSLTFEYNEAKIQFLTASETSSSQTSNSLTFDYSNLNPFESRTIEIQMNVFPPPTTTINNLIQSTVTINPITGDDNEADNTFTLSQRVRSAYDPNDITVLEGEEITIEQADKYLHYLIRFQNTGNASAINVRVENILENKLDWDTMQLESLSHNGRVEITDGNNVAFIFDNINLADSTSDEPNSHGYIAYRIKPKSNVVLGDVFYNTADIYFDFNPAIITNTATTEIVSALSVETFNTKGFKIFPNPVSRHLNVQSKTGFDAIVIYNIHGIQLKTRTLSVPSLEFEMDVEGLSNGMYFIEIQSGNKKQVQKFMKR